jgi:hypothetical protein
MEVRRRWVVLCLVLLLQACDSGSGKPVADRDEARTAAPRCKVPDLEPTYFPWGEQTEPPRREYDGEIERAALIWTNPNDPREGIALTIYPESAGAPEDPLNVTIQGAPGYLHNGSPGEHSAWWNLDARCNLLELSLSLEGVSPKAIDREVVNVAESLR